MTKPTVDSKTQEPGEEVPPRPAEPAAVSPRGDLVREHEPRPPRPRWRIPTDPPPV